MQFLQRRSPSCGPTARGRPPHNPHSHTRPSLYSPLPEPHDASPGRARAHLHLYNSGGDDIPSDPATPTRAALAKEEHGEARWSSGRYALAQAEARRKEAQRLRVRVAKEGARRGVQLGLAELVQVAEELEDVGAASLRQAQRRPVLPQVLPERVPVAPFLRPVPAQRLRPRCRRCPLQRGAVGVRQHAHGSAS